MSLLTAEYKGTNRDESVYTGKLAYLVVGNQVYFACIKRDAPDIYNAASVIVPLLEKLTGNPWQNLIFFSVETHNGSMVMKKGEYEIHRMFFNETQDGLKPLSWDLIDISANNRADLEQFTPVPKLPGIDPAILNLFKMFIHENAEA